jgi:glycine oxidase
VTDPAPNSVIIVGGGVIGSGIAFELAKRGVPVTLVERARIGGEASWASAGVISLPSRPWVKPERVELGRISLELYPILVAELEERTGWASTTGAQGNGSSAVDDEHAAAEEAVAVWQQGMRLDVEDVPPDIARRRSRRCRNRWSPPGFIPMSVHFRSTG